MEADVIEAMLTGLQPAVTKVLQPTRRPTKMTKVTRSEWTEGLETPDYLFVEGCSPIESLGHVKEECYR